MQICGAITRAHHIDGHDMEQTVPWLHTGRAKHVKTKKIRFNWSSSTSQRKMGKGDVERGLMYQARGHWLNLLVSKGAAEAAWRLQSLCDISGRHTNLSEELHLCGSHENRGCRWKGGLK